MKKVIVLAIFLLAILTQGCDKNNDHKSVLGTWRCQEQPEKTLPRVYDVFIERDKIYDTLFLISNFYNLGFSEELQIRFYQKDNELIIKEQYVNNGSVYIRGKGILADDFSTIKWEYYIDNGTVQEDVVATYY